MLYMVECGFSDPSREEEWSTWYSGPKIARTLTVPGFLRSQRFKSVLPTPSPYIAVHTIASGDIFNGPNYSGIGGGSFNEWQPYITNWRRTLFSGLDTAPEVRSGECLLVLDGKPSAFNDLSLPVIWLESAGLDHAVPWRGILPVGEAEVERLRGRANDGLRIFRPITPQMRRPV